MSGEVEIVHSSKREIVDFTGTTGGWLYVYIPLSEEEREALMQPNGACFRIRVFQSSPGVSTGRNPHLPAGESCPACFNPRPASPPGATTPSAYDKALVEFEEQKARVQKAIARES